MYKYISELVPLHSQRHTDEFQTTASYPEVGIFQHSDSIKLGSKSCVVISQILSTVTADRAVVAREKSEKLGRTGYGPSYQQFTVIPTGGVCAAFITTKIQTVPCYVSYQGAS